MKYISLKSPRMHCVKKMIFTTDTKKHFGINQIITIMADFRIFWGKSIRGKLT